MDKKVANGFGDSRDQDSARVASIPHPNQVVLGGQLTCLFHRGTAMLAQATLFLPGSGHTLVSVRRVVPSSDVTMDT